MAISAQSAQEFVPVQEINSGTVIMNDGTYRGVILCSSINFALKSADERAATLSQFQSFLNSLDFSVQIVVQSRRLDIKPYMQLLSEREKVQINDLMRVQLREYMGFIQELTSNINIMTKSFFLVVPYSPVYINTPKSGLFSFGKKKSFEEKNMSFFQHKSQLDERIQFVMQGLQRTGVRTQQLGTEELIELYYKTFNPGDSQNPIKQN